MYERPSHFSKANENCFIDVPLSISKGTLNQIARTAVTPCARGPRSGGARLPDKQGLRALSAASNRVLMFRFRFAAKTSSAGTALGRVGAYGPVTTVPLAAGAISSN